jgi:hypothetical protein
MLAHGSDRFRVAGERVILHSRLSKGWTARRPAQGTHSEFPGTAVLWDEQYFEVAAADPLPNGGVRYTLLPWRDDQTIRVFEEYSAASEARLAADYQAAQKQRRSNVAARLASVFLGNLPFDAQTRIANELGVSPFRMTMISFIPSVLLLGICVFLMVDAVVKMVPSPIPGWLWMVSVFWLIETGLRYFVAMSQSRGIGSLIGCFVYVLLHPREAVGESKRVIAPQLDIPLDVEIQDRLHMRGPLLTLLSPKEQLELERRYGFNYRDHAYFITWLILAGATVGAISSAVALSYRFRLTALLSLLVAAILIVEQIVRLQRFRRGPAGSVLAFVVRPFARSLLEHA